MKNKTCTARVNQKQTTVIFYVFDQFMIIIIFIDESG